MVDLEAVTQVAVALTFVSLAVGTLMRAPRYGSAGRWVAMAFSSLALALSLTWGLSFAGVDVPDWLARLVLLLIVLFPYLLLRFTASFVPLPRTLEVVAGIGALISCAIVFLVTAESDVAVLLAALLVYWVGVALITVVRLWSAGRGQPTVARKRTRLMSLATAALIVALLLEVFPQSGPSWLHILANTVTLVSALAFGLGLQPPLPVRLWWNQPETDRVRQGTRAVLAATTMEEITAALLPPSARLVGASGVALVDSDQRVLASFGDAPAVGEVLPPLPGRESADTVTRESVSLEDGRRELVVWTNPYTPFFGRYDLELLRAMAAIATIAFQRFELLESERRRRAELEQQRIDAENARQEAEIARAEAEVARAEAEAAREDAEAAREEANRANTAKTEFLARMSHELRTPLNAILGFGQLLETSPLSEEDADAVRYILKGGRHLLALINDVLDLAGIEAGTLTMSLEPVHAAELIQDTLPMVRPLAASRNIELRASEEGCDVFVKTDRQRCRQVLLNLLSNAVKYNRDGGAVEVWCTRPDEKTLRILVRDTGPGIDPSRFDRLFSPFDRLGAEHTKVDGTGLGLALSRQLIERLGGALGVDSAPGNGSTFWLDLPLTEAPLAEDEAAAPATTAGRAAGRTLLLVEDNLANLQVVQAMLRRLQGIDVLPAMQGGLAVDLATQHRPDVIVLDLHLPDVPGREVLHRLRSDPRTRGIPVVIASADASPRRIRQLLDEGAFDYVTKPLDLNRFLEVIDSALNRSRSRD